MYIVTGSWARRGCVPCKKISSTSQWMGQNEFYLHATKWFTEGNQELHESASCSLTQGCKKIGAQGHGKCESPGERGKSKRPLCQCFLYKLRGFTSCIRPFLLLRKGEWSLNDFLCRFCGDVVWLSVWLWWRTETVSHFWLEELKKLAIGSSRFKVYWSALLSWGIELSLLRRKKYTDPMIGVWTSIRSWRRRGSGIFG